MKCSVKCIGSVKWFSSEQFPFLGMSCIYIQGKDVLKTLVIYLDTFRIFYGLLCMCMCVYNG